MRVEAALRMHLIGSKESSGRMEKPDTWEGILDRQGNGQLCSECSSRHGLT